MRNGKGKEEIKWQKNKYKRLDDNNKNPNR